MKIYVTRFALTSGIQEFDADKIEGDMVVAYDQYRCRLYFHGNDWHRTREAAVARAEEMRVKKLQSLERQIKKVSKLVF